MARREDSLKTQPTRREVSPLHYYVFVALNPATPRLFLSSSTTALVLLTGAFQSHEARMGLQVSRYRRSAAVLRTYISAVSQLFSME